MQQQATASEMQAAKALHDYYEAYLAGFLEARPDTAEYLAEPQYAQQLQAKFIAWMQRGMQPDDGLKACNNPRCPERINQTANFCPACGYSQAQPLHPQQPGVYPAPPQQGQVRY